MSLLLIIIINNNRELVVIRRNYERTRGQLESVNVRIKHIWYNRSQTGVSGVRVRAREGKKGLAAQQMGPEATSDNPFSLRQHSGCH